MKSNIEKVISELSPELKLEEAGDKIKACCPFHEENTPSFVIFPETESWYCFGSCSVGGDVIDYVQNLYPDLSFNECKSKVKEITGNSLKDIKKEKVEKDQASKLPKHVTKEFQSDKVFVDKYRGISRKTREFFKQLSKVDDEGKVLAMYYPETRDGKLFGYKCRNHPKDFSYGKIGNTGVKSDLAGQFRFNYQSKYILICGGEEDLVAAYQMLADHQKQRGTDDFNAIPVVSPTSGEGSAAKQCATQYDWFDKNFDNIIIGMDNDDAGIKAAKKIAEVLPKEKVKIATWSGKDPNEMLLKGQQKQFLRDFYNAKDYTKTAVITSIEADKHIEEELSRKKISLPPFMSKLEKMFAGGIPLGYIVNICATTGLGKTTVMNEAIRHWIYNSPYKVGIMSLELNAGQYMLAMLSREVGHKISLIENPEDALEFVSRSDVQEARKRLREHEHGEERFALLDERDGTLENTQKQCELLFNKYDCKVLIIDPLQDVIESATQEEQLKFIKWMKSKVKSGYTFITVNHVRKSSNSTNREGVRVKRQLTEDDVHGLSAIVKSAGANIFLSRDKYAEDLIERNTTTVECGKCRWTGLTGNAGYWYYDNDSHTMYDFDEYMDKMIDENDE